MVLLHSATTRLPEVLDEKLKARAVLGPGSLCSREWSCAPTHPLRVRCLDQATQSFQVVLRGRAWWSLRKLGSAATCACFALEELTSLQGARSKAQHLAVCYGHDSNVVVEV